MTYVLDACSLIALYKKEKGLDKIRVLLDEALAGQAEIYMHSINLIEVYYLFCRVFGKGKSDVILDEIYKMPINLIDFIDNTIFSETSRLKAQYAIPLGDAIGLATAIKFGKKLFAITRLVILPLTKEKGKE
ncbi:PIN domain-containing protein [Treponema sp. R80B11-R83G3]